MEVLSIEYKPQVNIRLSEEEVGQLIDCTLAHYDNKCKNAGKQGGFIYGWRNAFVEFKYDSVMVDFRQCDTVTKILEVSHYATNRKNYAEVNRELRAKFKKAIYALREAVRPATPLDN